VYLAISIHYNNTSVKSTIDILLKNLAKYWFSPILLLPLIMLIELKQKYERKSKTEILLKKIAFLAKIFSINMILKTLSMVCSIF